MLFRTQRPIVLLISAALLVIGSAQSFADLSSGSWYLDQSNTFADGMNYGRVDILADSSLGTVTFTVDAFNVQPQYGTLSNFGIQQFGFNFEDITSDPEDWILSLPTGWSQGTGKMDGFGTFLVRESGSGGTRQDPLVFTITLPTHSEAEAGNFAVASTGTAGEGHVFFAPHVAGFNLDGGDLPTSHYIGGSTPVPVPAPAAWVLGAVGFGAVGLIRRVRPDLIG